MTELTTRIEPPVAEVPWTLRRREETGAARHWKQWWPAGLLLSASIFGLTYMKAWTSDTSGVHLLFWLAAAVMVVTVIGLVAAGPSRTSGFAASLSLGLLLFIPKLLHSPLFFNYFDELAHFCSSRTRSTRRSSSIQASSQPRGCWSRPPASRSSRPATS